MAKNRERVETGAPEGSRAAAEPAVRDAPIEKRADDRLGRAQFADAIAQHIIDGNLSDGAVVAVMGPWGSGKTSVLNMVREALGERPDDVEIFDFNPWYFSGTQQLVEHFFADTAARFTESGDETLTKAAGVLKRYAGVVRPAAHLSTVLGALGVPGVSILAEILRKGGDAAKDAADALGALAGKQTKSIGTLRHEMKEAFAKVDKRIVIVLDDLDRLRADEIRDMVRLVRLVADLPNTVYLLAFDRHRIEQALAEGFDPNDKAAGRNYLEKIVEVSFDLPATRQDDLVQMLFSALLPIVTKGPIGEFRKRDWDNYFGLGMRYLFTSPRDVHRYLNGLPVNLRLIGDEVSLADVLALEAVRVLAPDYFNTLPSAIELLTGTKRGGDQEEQDRLCKAYDALLDLAGRHRQAIERLNRHLFPTTQRFRRNVAFGGEQVADWKRHRHVAHPDVLRFHLEKTLPRGVLPARIIGQIVENLGDEAALVGIVDALTAQQFENVLDRLRSHEEDFPAGCAGVGLWVLFDRVSRIRRHTAHSFDMPPVWRLWSVGNALLTRIENLDERMAVLRAVFERLSSLTAKRALLLTAGYESEKEENIIVPKEGLDALAQELRSKVISSSAAQLTDEPDAAVLIRWAIGDRGEHPKAADLLSDDKFLLSLLHSDLAEGHWHAMDEIAQNLIQSLPRWDELARIFGAERWTTRVRELIERASKQALNDETRQVLELAGRYLTGWRPKP